MIKTDEGEDYNNTSPPTDKRFLEWAEKNHWQYDYSRGIWWNLVYVEPATSPFKLYYKWYSKQRSSHPLSDQAAMDQYATQLKEENQKLKMFIKKVSDLHPDGNPIELIKEAEALSTNQIKE